MVAFVETTESIIKELLTALGVSYKKVTHSELAGQVIFSIETDDSRPLIGTHGDTLYAIDLLVKKILEKRLGDGRREAPQAVGETASENGPPMFLVDVNDFRTKQIQDLQTKALVLAERARSFQYDVELTPMSAYERLIIHTTLQDAPNVKTESQGEGRNRRVVIKYSAG
jgi:spoIIIJ-associated protein